MKNKRQYPVLNYSNRPELKTNNVFVWLQFFTTLDGLGRDMGFRSWWLYRSQEASLFIQIQTGTKVSLYARPSGDKHSKVVFALLHSTVQSTVSLAAKLYSLLGAGVYIPKDNVHHKNLDVMTLTRRKPINYYRVVKMLD